MIDHLKEWIFSLASFGLLAILAVPATARPAQNVTNPYSAKQVQSMLHPSSSVLPRPLYPSTASSAIERLLAPQLKKLRVGRVNSTRVEAQVDVDETPGSKENHVRFRSVPTWSAAPSGDPSDAYALAVADFDRRSGPDVATVQTNGTLNILYNRGKGNLATSYVNTSAVALNPVVTSIKQADLNGDGYADIVAMDALNSALLIFINRTDGTFSDAVCLSVTPASGASFINGGAFTVGDVNGDGELDIVAISNLQNTDRCCKTVFSQQTFLGNGKGTFRSPTEVDTTQRGFSAVPYGDTLAIAHIYGQKVFDLVMEVGEFAPSNSLSIRVIRGKADGTFRKVPVTGATVNDAQANIHAGSFALADYNHDGHLDVAFTATDANIYVSLADAKGSLQTPSPALSGLYTAALVTAADLNKDGNSDLVVFAMGEVAIFTGHGDGTFAAAAAGQYAAGSGSNQLPESADFNSDGNLDIATLDRTNNQVAIYHGEGNGRLAGAGVIYPARNRPGASPGRTDWGVTIEVAVTGDFDADGRSDILAYNPLSASPALDIGTSNVSGRFLFKEAMSAPQLQSLAEQYQSVGISPVSGDFNADGRADLVLQTFAGLAVSTTQADGTFAAPVPVTFPVPIYCQPINFLDIGDVNGDRRPDIVAAYAQNPFCPPSESTPTGFFVLLSDGRGGFNTTFQAFGDALYYIKLADFDGDGKLDLALGNVYDSNNARFNIYVLRGKGDGTFDTTRPFRPIDNQIITGIVPGDYDRDGKQDLTLLTAGEVGSDGSPVPGTEGVLLLPGHGDFTFRTSSLTLPGVISISGKYSDFNGDGNLDLAVDLYASAQQTRNNFGMIVLPNSGGGSFGAPMNLLLPYQSFGPNSEVFIGDFNGDGAPDIVAGLGLSSALFLNRGID